MPLLLGDLGRNHRRRPFGADPASAHVCSRAPRDAAGAGFPEAGWIPWIVGGPGGRGGRRGVASRRALHEEGAVAGRGVAPGTTRGRNRVGLLPRLNPPSGRRRLGRRSRFRRVSGEERDPWA